MRLLSGVLLSVGYVLAPAAVGSGMGMVLTAQLAPGKFPSSTHCASVRRAVLFGSDPNAVKMRGIREFRTFLTTCKAARDSPCQLVPPQGVVDVGLG